jgi:hypothetical protein
MILLKIASFRNWAIGILLLVVVWPVNAELAGNLGYQVVYAGVFSLERDLPIADVSLETRVIESTGSILSHMQATSERYGVVESLYPVRYRFRSWSESVNGHLVALETYEKTTRERHRLYRRRAAETAMTTTDMAGSTAFDGPSPADARAAADVPFFDRIGLLQRIRREDLATGKTFDYLVTNGKRNMRYQVKVGRATTLTLGGHPVASWKLRIDAWEKGDRGKEEVSHRPVYLWLSRDHQRIPLRADVRHAVGLFRLTLNTPEALNGLAALAAQR